MRQRSLILFFFLLVGMAARAQTIRGVVSDAVTGEPLVGATVSLKGETVGTITDYDGNYELELPDGKGDPVLVVSYLGYIALEEPAGNRTEADFQLHPDAAELEEVVVVGYGTQSRRKVISAIASLDNEKIKDLPVAGLDQALQGQVAGVNVSQAGGAPGSGVSVRIRGVGSIGAGSEPLYVIDGYPFYNSGGAGGNPLNFINPADIEKIDVLKDASATAIYGSRGANGVIMITTKRGKQGQSRIQFSMSEGFQELGKTIPMMGAEEYIQFVAEARNNYYSALGFDTTDNNIFRFINVGNVAMIPDFSPFRDSTGKYPGFGGETDWLDQIFQRAPIRNYQLTASGGTENIQYAITGGYFFQEGIVRGTDFERFNLRANIDAQITPKIRAGISLSPSFSIRNDRNTAGNFFNGGIINAAMVMPPAVPVYEPDGAYFSIRVRGEDRFNTRLFDQNNRVVNPTAPQLPGVENPRHLIDNAIAERKEIRTIGNIFLDYEPIRGLHLRTSLAADVWNDRGRNFTYQINEFVDPPSASQFASQTFNWLSETTASYDFKIGSSHQFTALAGYTAQKNTAEGINVQATEYSAVFNPYIDPNLATISSGGAFESPWSLESYLARLNYGFRDKYLLTLTYRRDGSSRFGPGNRYGDFPSVAVGWRVSEEPFLKKAGWLADLKLRGSYGLAGNFEIGNFQWVGLVNSVNYVFGPGAGQVVSGAIQTSPNNESLTWEKSAQLNAGMDISLFDYRVKLIFDYYTKTTTDLLLDAQLPFSSGFVSFTQNVGEMINRGWEFTASTLNVEGRNFSWSTDFNISYNENEVTGLSAEGERIFTGDYHVTQKGHPVGNFFGYVSEGVYLSQEEVEQHNVTLQNASPYPGARRYADLNGDGRIDGNDQAIIGNPLPDFILGFNNRVSYRGFDLSVQVNGVFGNEIYNVGRAITESGAGFHNNTMRVWEERYISPEEPGNGQIPLVQAGTIWNNELRGSHLVEDGSFVRIRNVTLGYRLPEVATGKIGIQSLRFYFSGQNLYTFTDYLGFDPEVSSQGTSQLLGGIDFGGYPLPRIFTFGLNASF